MAGLSVGDGASYIWASNADTGEVVAQRLTEAGTDDASQVKPLLRQVPQGVARCDV